MFVIGIVLSGFVAVSVATVVAVVVFSLCQTDLASKSLHAIPN